MLRNWPGVFWPNDGGLIMSAITGFVLNNRCKCRHPKVNECWKCDDVMCNSSIVIVVVFDLIGV